MILYNTSHNYHDWPFFSCNPIKIRKTTKFSRIIQWMWNQFLSYRMYTVKFNLLSIKQHNKYFPLANMQTPNSSTLYTNMQPMNFALITFKNWVYIFLNITLFSTVCVLTEDKYIHKYMQYTYTQHSYIISIVMNTSLYLNSFGPFITGQYTLPNIKSTAS